MQTLAYQISQKVLAFGACDPILSRIRELAFENNGGRMLDVGCGPRSWLSRVGLNPVGLDSSLENVRAVRRAGFEAVHGSATNLPFADQEFDSVWSFGLLHHLNDAETEKAVSEMIRATKTGGFVVVFDAVLPYTFWMRPVAWVIRRLDLGKWMRKEGQLKNLLELQVTNWNFNRFTYAWTGLEGLFGWVRKS